MRPAALITGAARRLGRATAIELASAGFDLVLHYNTSRDAAEEVAGICRERGARVHLAGADLGQVEGCRALADAVGDAGHATLHLLVNNASLFEARPFAAITPEEWDHMAAVNTRAPFLLSQMLLERLAAADGSLLGAPPGHGGVVVHLCDIGGDRPVAGYVHYSVSKAALAMLVRAMAVELAPAVRTVGLAPGHLMWPEGFSGEARERIARRIPMGRVGTPEDVARLVRFVATEGHYINGAILRVDGGLASSY